MSSGGPASQSPAGEVSVADYEVVLVTYHSADQLSGLLEAADPEQRLVVVDNASGADAVEDIVARFPNGRYLDGKDSGFARAANAGARSSTAEYVVFSNPDSRPTPEIWARLIADLRADPNLASVSAATVDPSGHIEIGAGGYEPSVGRAVAHAIGLHRLVPGAGVYARPEAGAAVDLDWLNGACMAVRRETFVELGGWDERYFVYNEDMAFGRKVREAGLKQRLRTDLLVPHATGGSGGGGTKMPQQRGASMRSYLRHHNGRVAADAMVAALTAGTLVRIAAARVRRNTGLARQHQAYVRGILTGRSPYQD